MKNIIVLFLLGVSLSITAQEIIPLDTSNFAISERASFMFEEYRGKNSLYLKGGILRIKNKAFKNGTIEFDLFIKEKPSFPGVSFRVVENDAEQFYIRPHQSGNPDANQVAPTTNGITPWQLYFGPKYSFPYTYKYDDWTHIKIVINEDKAQVYLDHSNEPNLSWNLFHETREGGIFFQCGSSAGIHIADVIVDPSHTDIIDFKPLERKPLENLVQEWEISDMFENSLLKDVGNIPNVIKERTWGRKITVEEGVAANISRKQLLRNGDPGETVFARLKINSDKDQVKLFHFGYSDDVIAILNGKPIYKGTNIWRSRDYRYLGTIGLFDSIYLHLKKGENILDMAVSENFGGWLITGKFDNESEISY